MQKAIYSVSQSMAQRLGVDSRAVIRDGIDYVVRTGIAYRGKCYVEAFHDPMWGPGKDYNGPVLENPTWGQLFKESERQMLCTGDLHHCYFEGYEIKNVVNGVATLVLWMGS